MKKKHFGPLAFALALLLAPLAPALAQDDYGEVALNVSYGRAALRWTTLQTFFDSYNEVNKADIRTKVTLPTATVVSVNAHVANWVCLRYEQLRGDCQADFTSGLQRRFELRQHLLLIGIEPLFRGKHLFAGPTLGLGAGDTRVGSYVVYPDGTVSWGRERNLSGSYRATGIRFSGGLRAGYQWPRVLLALRGEWVPGGTDSIALRDNIQGGAAEELPLDYAAFLAVPPVGANSRVYESVKPDLASYRVSFEIGFRLNPAVR